MAERTITAPGARDELDAIVGELVGLIARERASHLRGWCRQDLSMPSLHLLLALKAIGPVPMSRVAGILDTAGSNVTGIVTRLEERGLVERTHDVVDRRLVLVSLTEHGRQVAEDREFMSAQKLRRVLETMPPTERQGMVASLRSFLDASERLRAEGLLDDEPPCPPAS